MQPPKFFVIRGSGTAPQTGVVEAIQQRKEAERQVLSAQAQLNQAVEIEQEVETYKTEASSAELLVLVHKLHNRVEDLENKLKVAEKEKKKSQEEFANAGKQLLAGGFAGAVARTTVAPLDRVKLLMQTQFIANQAQADKYSSMGKTLRLILQEEGVKGFWRGNMSNILRVVPYSATQFASYDYYKRSFFHKDKLSTPERLLAGALAGSTATTVTHPLDVIRLQISVYPHIHNMRDACQALWADGGFRAFFKGYIPTVVSLSPFIAINFACFDSFKHWYYPDPRVQTSSLVILGLGGAAGIVAQTICYPLDVIRRRMQMKGKVYGGSVLTAISTIYKQEGVKGYYKGMWPNTVKVLPNNAIRFMAYEWIKKQIGLKGREGGGGGGG